MDHTSTFCGFYIPDQAGDAALVFIISQLRDIIELPRPFFKYLSLYLYLPVVETGRAFQEDIYLPQHFYETEFGGDML